MVGSGTFKGKIGKTYQLHMSKDLTSIPNIQIMLVTERLLAATLVLSISGRFDQNNDMALETALLRGQEKKMLHVILNLEQVSSIDTAGIGRIFLTFFRLKHNGICLSLVNPKPHVLEILDLVEIPKILRVFESDDAALAWQASSPQFPSATPNKSDWELVAEQDGHQQTTWLHQSSPEASA